MTIQSYLTRDLFRNFTVFDILKRRKLYKSPVIFALILSACAAISFAMNKVQGAVFLGCVLLAVGLGMPVMYFATFFSSLKKSVKAQKLDTPRLVYSVELATMIKVSNEKETASYEWEKCHSAFFNKDCIYLFITKDRAFLLPLANMYGKEEEVWSFIKQKLGTTKCKDLRK